MKNNIRLFIIPRSIRQIRRNVSENAALKIKTHISYSIIFIEKREIMWKNMEETDTPQMTIWRMRIACCIPKVTNKHIRIHNKMDI
jgi:hypothetical protein